MKLGQLVEHKQKQIFVLLKDMIAKKNVISENI